jgi:uncharacterized membrane protein
MIRDHLFHKRASADAMFRWRGEAVSRLEALADAVFAVTLTLLIVSISVPATFYELWNAVRDLPIFLVSFAMIMMAWQYHYLYFRRYGLEDFTTSFLNAVFLFLILFMAYPLKFMATFLWRLILGDGLEEMFVLPEGVQFGSIEKAQQAWMMGFYAAGIIGVFGVLALMQLRAYAKREELELDQLEVHLTLTGLIHHLIMVSVAMLSMIIVIAGGQPGYAGVIYFLLGPLHGIFGWLSGRRADRLHQELVNS